MHTELNAQGVTCGKHRVARLMRRAGVRAKSTPTFRVTTRSNAAQPAAPNVLQRHFTLETNPALRVRDRVWARTSHAFRRARAGSIWPSFLISPRAGLRAGPYARSSSSRSGTTANAGTQHSAIAPRWSTKQR